MRAYGRAAKLALDAAGISVQRVWSQVRIPCPYHLFERVRLEVAAFGGQVQDTDFAADVTLDVLLPEEQTAPFLLRLQDLSGGKMQTGGHGNVLPGLPGGKIGGMERGAPQWRNWVFASVWSRRSMKI